MGLKTIKKIIASERVNMGGHILDQPLPIQDIESINPFLLIHHWDHPVSKGSNPKDIGVGPHPHRGFSPVTFVFKGSVNHQDSLGNNATVSKGGTQWMHAGKGITHSERPSKQLAESGGENEFIQFWVNTPSKHKMEIPYYKPLSEEDTPTMDNGQVKISVVCGDQGGLKGAVDSYSPLTLLRVTMMANSKTTLTIPQSYNCLIYLLDGKLQIQDQIVKQKEMVWFNQAGEDIEIEALDNTRFILLSGEPINEKVSSYGPFVMNTQTEIMEAIRDAQTGKMGVLIEEF